MATHSETISRWAVSESELPHLADLRSDDGLTCFDWPETDGEGISVRRDGMLRNGRNARDSIGDGMFVDDEASMVFAHPVRDPDGHIPEYDDQEKTVCFIDVEVTLDGQFVQRLDRPPALTH